MNSSATKRPHGARVWWLAIRPATLWAAVAPVLVGSACAIAMLGFRPRPALAALVCALLIQIGTNLANDLFDFRKGADTRERLGPTRAVQAGWLSERDAWIGTWIAFAMAVVVGLYLAWIAGPIVILVGAVSIASGVFYTAGPFPLAYLGLGDLFVFFFFGFVAVAGTFYVQTLEVAPLVLWAAIPVGALSTAILVINNLRDVDTDRKAGKRTLAVRFGVGFTRVQYIVLLSGAFLVPLFLYGRSLLSWPVLLPMLLAPLVPILVSRSFSRKGAELNPLLGDTARLLLVFSMLFSIGIVWASIPEGAPSTRAAGLVAELSDEATGTL